MQKLLIALALTVGIILPVGVLSKPSGGYRWPFGKEKRSFRRSAKMQLSFLIYSIGALEQAAQGNARYRSVALTKEQARLVGDAIKPWQKKSPLWEPEAKLLYERLFAFLTPRQQEELWHLKEWTSPVGGRSWDENITEQQRQAIETFRGHYNLFYPPESQKGYYDLPVETRQRYADRYVARNSVLTGLMRKAKGLQVQTHP